VFQREPSASLGCGGAAPTSCASAHSRRTADLADADYAAGETLSQNGLREFHLNPVARHQHLHAGAKSAESCGQEVAE